MTRNETDDKRQECTTSRKSQKRPITSLNDNSAPLKKKQQQQPQSQKEKKITHRMFYRDKLCNIFLATERVRHNQVLGIRF